MGLLDWFRQRTPKLGQETISESLLREATDYLVKMTDPRLALVDDYRGRMAAAVRTSLRFIAEAQNSLMPPRPLTVTSWALDPCIKAVFVHPDELIEVASRSADLRDFVDRSGATDEIYAVLASEVEERRRLGIALQGGMVVRDVAQTTLNFTNHRLRLFGHSRDDLWQAVSRRLLDEMALVALCRMQGEQAARRELEHSRTLLTSRLAVFEQRGTGMDSFLGESGQTGTRDESRELLHQLEINEQQLAQLGTPGDALGRQLDYLCEVLSVPEQHVSFLCRKVRLNSMNVVQNGDGDGDGEGDEIEFNVVRIERQPDRVHAMIPVCVDRRVIRDIPAMTLDEAEKLI